MPTTYLLDTGVASAYLNNDPAIRRRLKGGVFIISVIVAGELFHGAFNSSNRSRNLDSLRQFLAPLTLLPCNAVTAERFGLIATSLQQRGLTIPHNDIWIAAQAVQHQHRLTLLTRDPRHMSLIDGLRWERW